MPNHNLPPGPGRPKGSENKARAVHRQFWQEVLDQEGDNIKESLQQVRENDPAAYLKIVVSLTEFVMPKLSRTELTGTEGETISVTLNLGKTNSPDANH